MSLDEETLYEASLDIRPGAADVSPSEGSVQSGVVEVRCGAGARLTRLGDSITVEDEGEWLYREFGSAGVFEWTWRITATRPEDARVQLELRPAVPIDDGEPGSRFVVPGNEDPSIPTADYTTEIRVQAGLVDEVGHFLTDDWPTMLTAAGVAGAAAIGLVTWVRRLIAAARGDGADGRTAPDGAATESRDPAPQDRRRRRERPPPRTRAGTRRR